MIRPETGQGAAVPAERTEDSPTEGRAPRRTLWRVLAASVVVLVVSASAIGLYLLRSPVPAGDEFEATSDEGTQVAWGTPQDVGAVFTDASAFLVLAHGSVTLTSVDAKIEGSSTRAVGEPMVAQLLPEATHFLDTLPAFPPTSEQIGRNRLGPLTSARGAVLKIPPGEDHATYILFFGLKVIGQGRTVRGEPTITYRLAGHIRSRTLRLPTKLIVCSPKTTPAGSCT